MAWLYVLQRDAKVSWEVTGSFAVTLENCPSDCMGALGRITVRVLEALLMTFGVRVSGLILPAQSSSSFQVTLMVMAPFLVNLIELLMRFIKT